jgi:hypothetical protein
MISLEPSWEDLGEIVAQHISQSNIQANVKTELQKTVLQMANIAHYARKHQVQEKIRNGELSPSEAPIWATDNFDPLCPKCKKLIDGCYGGCLACDLADDLA